MNTTVKNLFNQFCKVYNLQTSATCKEDNPSQNDFYSNAFVKMDYNPSYGGYRIDIVNTNTSEDFWDSMGRKTAKEMIAYIRGLLAAKSQPEFNQRIFKPSASKTIYLSAGDWSIDRLKEIISNHN